MQMTMAELNDGWISKGAFPCSMTEGNALGGPKDETITVASSRFRALVGGSRTSPTGRSQVLTVYAALRERPSRIVSREEIRVLVTAPAEYLDLIPLVRDDVESMLSRECQCNDPLWGTWNYLLELFLRKVQTRLKRALD